MCQFNYTIVKNKKSVFYLRNRGYGCLHLFPGGYKAFGGNRPGFCDCGSMVGSHSLTLKNEGHYPIDLFAKDYWRAIKAKESRISEEIPNISWNSHMQEFHYYRRIFQHLLEFEPYLCFTHIFDEPGELRLVKTLRLCELQIGDLALLRQDDVLRIRR